MIRLLIPALLVTAGLVAGPAAAQGPTDYAAIVRIMRECAKISDVPARVACYDNTVRLEPRVVAVPAAPPVPPPPRGFAAESLPQTPAERASLPAEAQLRVTAAAELAPRMYRLTLEDGGVWEMIEAVPMSYDPPRRGAAITLIRGGLGGFLMNYAGQPSVRLRRVR